MTHMIEDTARALCASIQAARGYSALDERGHAIIFIPTPMVDGLSFPAGIIVTEVGHGSAIIENPKRLNRFVFAKSGFTLPAGDFAAKVIKRLVVLMEANMTQPETGHSAQIENMEKANG